MAKVIKIISSFLDSCTHVDYMKKQSNVQDMVIIIVNFYIVLYHSPKGVSKRF